MTTALQSPVSGLLPSEDLVHVLRHTAGLWLGARRARFFITGGTGFFGRWLVGTLLHASDTLRLDLSVTVLSRNPPIPARISPGSAGENAGPAPGGQQAESVHPALNYIKGDVRDFPFSFAAKSPRMAGEFCGQTPGGQQAETVKGVPPPIFHRRTA